MVIRWPPSEGTRTIAGARAAGVRFPGPARPVGRGSFAKTLVGTGVEMFDWTIYSTLASFFATSFFGADLRHPAAPPPRCSGGTVPALQAWIGGTWGPQYFALYVTAAAVVSIVVVLATVPGRQCC